MQSCALNNVLQRQPHAAGDRENLLSMRPPFLEFTGWDRMVSQIDLTGKHARSKPRRATLSHIHSRTCIRVFSEPDTRRDSDGPVVCHHGRHDRRDSDGRALKEGGTQRENRGLTAGEPSAGEPWTHRWRPQRPQSPEDSYNCCVFLDGPSLFLFGPLLERLRIWAQHGRQLNATGGGGQLPYLAPRF